jgi:hypothetical protein
VVRDLVDRNEQEIEALLQELGAALREAEDTEQRVVALAGALQVTLPSDGPDPDPCETVPDAGGKHTSRPRTTVVTRIRGGGADPVDR